MQRRLLPLLWPLLSLPLLLLLLLLSLLKLLLLPRLLLYLLLLAALLILLRHRQAGHQRAGVSGRLLLCVRGCRGCLLLPASVAMACKTQ